MYCSHYGQIEYEIAYNFSFLCDCLPFDVIQKFLFPVVNKLISH